MPKKKTNMRDNSRLNEKNFRDELKFIRMTVLLRKNLDDKNNLRGKKNLRRVKISGESEHTFFTVQKYDGRNIAAGNGFSHHSLNSVCIRARFHQKKLERNTRTLPRENFSQEIKEIVDAPRKMTPYLRRMKIISEKRKIAEMKNEKLFSDAPESYQQTIRNIENTIINFGLGIPEEKPETRTRQEIEAEITREKRISKMGIKRFGK